MAFTRPTLPFKLTPEDLGSFNAPKAATQGASYVDHIIQTKLKSLEANKNEAQLPYAIDDIKSLIALRNAQARIENTNASIGNTKLNLLNDDDSGGGSGGNNNQNPNAPNTPTTGTTGSGVNSGMSFDANGANTVASPEQVAQAAGGDQSQPTASNVPGQTNVNQDEAGMTPQGQPSRVNGSQTEHPSSLINNATPQNNSSSQDMGNNNIVPGIPGQSYYGVPMPAPTKHQLGLSSLMSTDTYSKSAELAKDAQHDQIKQYDDLSSHANTAADKSQDLLNSFNRFDNSLKDVTLKGAQLGKAPKWLSSQERDKAIHLAADLGKAGISTLKEAMGNSRFAVMEFNYGVDNLSPNITWGKQAIDSYGDKLKAANTRVQEQRDLVNFYKNNPQLGMKKSNVDALISSLQTQYPVIDDKGRIKKSNEGKSKLYMTPEAIQSVRRFGRYYPKDDAKNDGAIGNEIAKTPYGGTENLQNLSTEELQARLNKFKKKKSDRLEVKLQGET